SGVTGVYDLRDVISEHESAQDSELSALILRHPVAPVLGQYGQVGDAPAAELRVVCLSTDELRQMPKAPANNIPAALKVSVFTRNSPDHRGNSLSDGGLFGYYECLHMFILSYKILEASENWPL